MDGCVIKTRMARPLTARWTNAIANFENKLLIVSGGFHPQSRLEHFSVEMYSIKKDEWSKAPSMNSQRYGHNSCCLGDYAYVVGGWKISGVRMSMERLNVRALLNGDPDTMWQKIIIQNYDYMPNESPLFFPTIDQEIVTLGDGYGSKLNFATNLE